MQDISIMSDRERSSPTLIESGLKNLIGGRDSNYPLISGINGKCLKSVHPKYLTIHVRLSGFPLREGKQIFKNWNDLI